ncbi:MAG: hypothetical protein QOJ65_1602 [Fimbriimonadaceae bacterium]|nr:hypothetical protein [Fimbriimonadaceae bacterium]
MHLMLDQIGPLDRLLDAHEINGAVSGDRERYVKDCGGADGEASFDRDLQAVMALLDSRPQALQLMNSTAQVIYERWAQYSSNGGPLTGPLTIPWEDILEAREKV